jgi:ATP-dependent helicase/DNAse subunit B
MQLPIYLYLVKNNNIKNSEVIGFYLQKILTGIPKIDKKSIVEQKEDALKLQGYTIDEEDLIKEFDSTYDKSKVIKSLGKTQNGFNAYSKILSKRQIESLYNLVDKKIDEAKDKILNTDFEIDPKRVGFNNVSCKYCKYKDICFMNQNNVKILEEIKDLSFLGGDDNANMD